MKYLVVLLSFFSVNFYSSSQDLSWGISLETGINLNKQEDILTNTETNPLFYTALGTHINYRLKNRFFVKSGIYLNRVNHESYSIYNDYSFYDLNYNYVTEYDSISIVSNSNSLVIPIGISIEVIKGVNVDFGLSLVRTSAKRKRDSKYFTDYYEEPLTLDNTDLNEIVETSVNNIYVGVNYTFDNGLGIGFKHVFVNRPNYFNELETNSLGFNTLTLSYDISQYKWM